MQEPEAQGPRGRTERGEVAVRGRSPRAAARARRQALGLAMLLLTVVPGHLMFRAPPPDAVVARAEAEDGEARESPISLLEIEAHIREVAARYGVSPRLVAAIVEAESEFNPRAESRKGARGLMQLMPATASSLQVEDAFDPYANLDGGVRHLRRLMDRFDGDLPIVLAAYNAGEQAVLAHRGVPPYRETRRYVRRILRRIGHPGTTAPAAATAKIVHAGGRAGPAAPAVEVEAAAGPPARPVYALWRAQEARERARTAPPAGGGAPPERTIERQGP